MRRVAAVIPNWNGSTMLRELLAALRVQTEPVDKIIVVDNGSTDDSVTVAKSAGAEVIELSVNTGFSHAVNLGITAAKTEWIVILNNDVVPNPAWLATMIGTADSAKAWFAAGKLLGASQGNRIDGAFDAICRGACAWRCGHGRLESPVLNQSRSIYFAP